MKIGRVRQRLQSDRLKRLIDFAAMRSEVNQRIIQAQDDQEFTVALSQILTQYAHVTCAAILRPNSHGWFEILSSSSEKDDIHHLPSSVDPAIPEGQGAIGHAWRTGTPYYAQSVDWDALPSPWQVASENVRIKSAAVLPIFRQNVLWGLLAVCHQREHGFDRALRIVLEAFAKDISNSLDILDIRIKSRHRQAVQAALLDTTSAGICMVRDRRLIAVNQRLAEMMGYSNPQQFVGQSTRFFFQTDDDYARVGTMYPDLLNAGKTSIAEVGFRRADGTTLICDMAGGRADDDRETSVWTILDVTARHQLEQQLAYQALHDALTNLPNRRALDARIQEATRIARIHQTAFAFGIIDLDDFKPINDTHGHNVGDAVLKDVARKLQGTLFPGDFIARLGGDEFVVIFDRLSPDAALEEIEPRLKALGEAMQTPISLEGGPDVMLAMSLGLALYPQDGVDGDGLLRYADAALYQAKTMKASRAVWWQWGTQASVDPAPPMIENPYSPEAKKLLKRAQSALSRVVDEFIRNFYSIMESGPEVQSILETLSPTELNQLRENQRIHWNFLLSSEATREDLARRSQLMGEVHAYIGVNATVLSRAMVIFRRLMIDNLRAIPEIHRELFQVVFLVDGLLQDNMQFQLEAAQSIWTRYLDILSQPIADDGALWADVSSHELELVANLPGIASCEMLRPDTDGIFHVEASAGKVALEMTDILRAGPYQPLLDENSETSHGLVPLAWHTGNIQSAASYVNDPRTRSWHEVLTPLGIRSMLAIPISDRDGRVALVLAIQGSYPHQFEDPQIRQWASALMQRWNSNWHHSTALSAQPVLPPEVSLDYRTRLFSGGFELYFQPIVDLTTGHPRKAEGLARIKMRDDQVVAPDQFIPLLGDIELDRLFRLGLDAALHHVTQLDRAQMAIEISVNLPPQTLLESELPMWVAQALRRYRIAPERLTLELLETQRLHLSAQNSAIAHLLKLGVKLAMDDLGSGYSSLERLARLPFHIIKFDKTLLARMDSDPLQTLALMSSIIQMGNDFGREVVIEGLENIDLIEAAMILGAPYGQGYGLGVPMPITNLQKFLSSFVFPVRQSHLQSPLGALAYHWHRTRTEPVHDGVDLTHCPLTEFFTYQIKNYSEAQSAHAALHGPHHPSESSAILTNLLVQEVMTSRRAPTS